MLHFMSYRDENIQNVVNVYGSSLMCPLQEIAIVEYKMKTPFWQ